MAYSRLLLLLIGVISTHLPEVHARSIGFWCNNDARKRMMEKIADFAGLDTPDTLPSPVQIPCVGLNTTEWTNKTLQQKRAEVLGTLQVFKDGVQSAKSNVTEPQSSLLEKLEKSIRHYLVIVNTVPIQSDDLTPSQSAVKNCSSQTSLSKVLEEYRQLLIGKVKYLFVDLQDMCPVEHRTINNQRS